MPIEDYERAAALIADHADRGLWVGPQPEERVARAEELLRVSFSPTYRRFLLDHGAGNFGATEVYGIVAELEGAGIPNMVWYTRELRGDGLPADVVGFAETGDGEVLCLRAAGADGPVLSFFPGSGEDPEPDDIAPDFGV